MYTVTDSKHLSSKFHLVYFEVHVSSNWPFIELLLAAEITDVIGAENNCYSPRFSRKQSNIDGYSARKIVTAFLTIRNSFI